MRQWCNEWGIRGISVAIGIAIGVTFAFAAWVWNPADSVVEPVAEEVGKAVDNVAGTNFVHETCPNGWDDVSSKDIHIRNLTCLRNGWLVVLNPDGTFSHCHQDNTPNAQFHYDAKECPGWPA